MDYIDEATTQSLNRVDSKPPIIMRNHDVSMILNNVGPSNFIGKGAAGSVYEFNYYSVPAVAKIPLHNNGLQTIQNEIIIYNHICKIFNKCMCHSNIVQMLGYNSKHGIIMLELFNGSDLTQYTGYPINPSTFLTHRLEPRHIEDSSADFKTLGKYLETSTKDGTIMKLFNDIYSGLVCLHSAKILHKDLELKNILIRSDGKVGITDFGLSRILDKGTTYYGFDDLLEVIKIDTDKLGHMMGNFVDSNNKLPYQYRLDLGSGLHRIEAKHLSELFIVDNMAILNKINDINLKDAFFMLIYFQDVAAYVSIIYYIKKNIDIVSGLELITEAASYYNGNIDEIITEIPEDAQDSMYITYQTVNNIVNNLYDNSTKLVEPSLYDLVNYFRLIASSLLNSVNTNYLLDPLLSSQSVYDYLRRLTGENYNEYISAMTHSIHHGYLLNNFSLFQDIYFK